MTPIFAAGELGLDPASGVVLTVIGLFLLAGYVAHTLGPRARLPRVTLLLLLGLIAGPSVLDLVPHEVSRWFPRVAHAALSIIGFQLGERFLGRRIRETGGVVLAVSLAEVLFAALAVFLILIAVQTPPLIALLLAAVAPASAPAATVDVINESQAKGPVAETVLGVVAIDDAWGVILFSLLVVVAQGVQGEAVSTEILLHGAREVLGGIGLGAVLGLPMAWLTGRIRKGELTLIEAMGFVFLCGGLAKSLEMSYILACMAMGAVVSNLARHHTRPFHAIKEIDQPFLIVFFLLAGFDFQIAELKTVGLVGVAYIAARALGLVAGGYLGASFARAETTVRSYVGWCLLPQAGVALGLGLLVAERFPELGSRILSLVVGTTVVFEVAGPVATRLALKKADEIPSEE